jgi:hypothetical protein
VNLKPITNLLGKQILSVRKHSPVILFGAGVVGIVTTVVLASRATLKLEEVLEDAQSNLELTHKAKPVVGEYTDEERAHDRILIYVQTSVKIARLYGPAIVVGAASIAALTGSHVILTRRNGALMAAYAVLDKGFKEYRRRVVEKYGTEADKNFRYGGAEREVVIEGKDGEKKVKIAHDMIPGNPSIYARCFDQTCSNWSREPMRNQFTVQCQQNYANDLLHARGYVFLNEVYEMLGIPKTKEGQIVGWLRDGEGDGYIDFGVFKGDEFMALRFVQGDEGAIWLDFNVDGPIYDKFEKV